MRDFVPGLFVFSILSSVLSSMAACGSMATDDDPADDQLDAPVGKADGASVPGGAYTNPAPSVGQLTTLVLDADHTFTSTHVVECIHAPCNPVAQHGHYLLTHSTNSSKRYVRLYADDNSDLGRWEWKVKSGGKLLLRDTETSGASFYSLAKGATCEDAGGSCTALTSDSPDACEGGSIGDATEYACGGGAGVECCLPEPESNYCATTSDCGGLVPQVWQNCGTKGCWAIAFG